MPRTEKYFVGPRLLDDIRQVITRVNGQPDKTSGPRFDVVHQETVRGGGGGAIRLGKVTAAWDKASLRDVIVHTGNPLSEQPANPAVVLTDCVNKFADVQANKWVMVGRANGRWYLIAAEC